MTKSNHRRNVIAGTILLFLSALFGMLTIIFIYVSNDATKQIDDIRDTYQQRAEKRDAKVNELTAQVGKLQQKVDSIPERTADKTADRVKEAVKEDEAK